MDLRDQAAIVAFNKALAAIVAEYVDSLVLQGLARQEAVAVAAVWQGTYLGLLHGPADTTADPGTHP